MELFKAIAKRHSYRGGFQKERIPREDLSKIVQAGIQAPSGKNAQTTEFVIIDDAEILRQLGKILDKKVVLEARAVIVCIIEEIPVFEGISFAVEDCAAAVENMLLAVTALEYATVWIDGVLRSEKRGERIARLLDLPAKKQVRIILPLGAPTEEGTQREKKPFEERAWFNHYP